MIHANEADGSNRPGLDYLITSVPFSAPLALAPTPFWPHFCALRIDGAGGGVGLFMRRLQPPDHGFAAACRTPTCPYKWIFGSPAPVLKLARTALSGWMNSSGSPWMGAMP